MIYKGILKLTHIIVASAFVMVNVAVISIYGFDGTLVAQDPFSSFKLGVSAYKNGDKDEALRALRFAAEQGHVGAKWKLARMYADGDGVLGDEIQAYQMFLKVVGDGAEALSDNGSYISDALVALGFYARRGIASANMAADPRRAREFFIRAAINYGHPVAQYELGRMLLQGEGGAADPLQAARWFQLAAHKGNPAAQAMLGHMLFQAGHEVRGLAMMTMAYERANAKDQPWIAQMQERAFAIVGEIERRTAISMANDLVIQSISKYK